MKQIIILFWFCLFSMGSTVSTGQLAFYAKSNIREVLTGSKFEVEFVLVNASGEQFKAPEFKDFLVVSGPDLSSQISIENGRRSQKKAFIYTLIAQKAGNFEIGPASITVKGKVLKSAPLKIRVVKAKDPGITGEIRPVFVQAELSDSIAYPGQKVLLRYVLYTTQRVKSYNFLSVPEYEGFYTQEISTRDQGQRRIIDGTEYSSQALKTTALFPQKLGELSIDPVQISLGLVNRNDPFSMFQQTKPFPVITNELVLPVIPLPENAPASFKGAVGKFKISTQLSNRDLTTDEAISLNIKVTGNGLAKFIMPPDLDLGENFEVYDPKVINEKTYPSNEDILSEKTFEYLLVPLKTGRHSVRAEFSYFDTDSSEYVTLYSPKYSVNIRKGQNSARELSPDQLLSKYQLRAPMMDTRLNRANQMFFGSFYFWLSFGILLLVFPLLILIKWIITKRGEIDPRLLKNKRASKEALKRLAHAKSLLGGDDHQAFYKEVSDALLKYVADKFSIETTDLTKEKIRSELVSHGLEEELSNEYLELLKKCEFSLFGGAGEKGNQVIYERSRVLLEKLELKKINS